MNWSHTMKRREKKQRKKIIFLLTLPLTAILLIGAGLLYLYFSPHISQIVSGKKEVKSAYIKKGSMKETQELLNKNRIKYENIEFADEGETFKVTLESGMVVNLSSSKSLEVQINTLHEIIRRLTIDSKAAKEIDLRFTRPIVKFK